jgi:hypothetical protein
MVHRLALTVVAVWMAAWAIAAALFAISLARCAERGLRWWWLQRQIDCDVREQVARIRQEQQAKSRDVTASRF